MNLKILEIALSMVAAQSNNPEVDVCGSAAKIEKFEMWETDQKKWFKNVDNTSAIFVKKYHRNDSKKLDNFIF